jgi:hypothetical protein
MKKTTTGLFFTVALLLSGCIGSPGSQEIPGGEVGVARSELLTMNALTMNALTMNALTMNALTMNALTMNALTMNALSPSNLGAIQAPSTAGDLSRLLLKYTVSCAFDATQSFDFTWTDGSNVVHHDTYWGSLGLATSWSTSPLTTSSQEWVSACLISRVNWYGVSVPLSARGGANGLSVTDPAELSTYSMEEGAFWGNLFVVSPYAYSCDNSYNDSYSRSSLRECAAGHVDSGGNLVDCGMIHRLGSCDAYCKSLTNKGVYHKWCQESTDGAAVQTDAVVTVFLQ